MLHIVRFTDKPDSQAIRETHLQAHLDWIAQNRSWLLLAGSMREAPEQAALGGLWIVDAASKAEVLEKMNADPFWVNGLRQSAEVFFWAMASEDMKIAAVAMAKPR